VALTPSVEDGLVKLAMFFSPHSLAIIARVRRRSLNHFSDKFSTLRYLTTFLSTLPIPVIVVVISTSNSSTSV